MFLVYAVQLLVYLLIAAVIGFLVFVAFYLTNVYNYTTGTAMFFVGMTFYSGFLLMFCCAFNKWQVTYTMHDFLGSAVILFLTLFIFIQLYGHSSISSTCLTVRLAFSADDPVSLVPLYFFVGDRGAGAVAGAGGGASASAHVGAAAFVRTFTGLVVRRLRRICVACKRRRKAISLSSRCCCCKCQC